MKAKPILLGMNNPLSDDPDFDLFPYPEGSAGYRLWKLLPEGTPRIRYLEAFERRNLLRAREWSQPAARAAAALLRPQLVGRCVVLLGTEVRAAMGLEPMAPLGTRLECAEDGRVQYKWVAMPHPSGRNLWYNNPSNRDAARQLLAKLGGFA